MHSATERLAAEKSLQNYQWLPSVAGDLLAKLGRTFEVRVQLEQAGQAAALAFNLRARERLLERVRNMLNPDDSGSSLKKVPLARVKRAQVAIKIIALRFRLECV